jgi:hypothetical protein
MTIILLLSIANEKKRTGGENDDGEKNKPKKRRHGNGGTNKEYARAVDDRLGVGRGVGSGARTRGPDNANKSCAPA